MNPVVVAETLRRHLTSAGYLAFIIVVVLIGLFAATFHAPGSMWPSLAGLLAMITGSSIIGPEFGSGELQLIVSKPISRSEYLLSRVSGVFLCVAIATLAGLAAEVGGRLVRGEIPWSPILTVLAGSLVTSLLTISILALLGSMTRSYFNAAIYFGTQLVLSVAQGILGMMRMKRTGFGNILRDNLWIERALGSIDQILFASPPGSLTMVWLLRTAATILAALVLACLIFQRREVPYGTD